MLPFRESLFSATFRHDRGHGDCDKPALRQDWLKQQEEPAASAGVSRSRSPTGVNAVKDVFFPLAIFVALHAVFIGAVLTAYIH